MGDYCRNNDIFMGDYYMNNDIFTGDYYVNNDIFTGDIFIFLSVFSSLVKDKNKFPRILCFTQWSFWGNSSRQ